MPKEEFNLEGFIKEQWGKMPEVMRDIVVSSKFLEKTEDIGKKHNLSDKATGILKTEIILLLLGATNPGDFLTYIKEGVPCNDKKAIELYNDINTQIFELIVKEAEEKKIEPIYKITPEQEKEYQKLAEEMLKTEGEILEVENVIKERLKLAPDIIKNLLVSEIFVKKIKAIGDKLQLNDEDLSTIESEITMELLTNFVEFKLKNIEDGLKERGSITKEKLPLLIDLIEKDILNQLRKEMGEKLNKFREGLKNLFMGN